MKKSLWMLVLLGSFIGCTEEKTFRETNFLPASEVCKDLAGVGPDIVLTSPPPINRQVKAVDGCRRDGGRCFYNCGKFAEK